MREHADNDLELHPGHWRHIPDIHLRSFNVHCSLDISCSPASFQASLLDQWTQFLITDSLIPANQLSTDDFAGTLANQTNLAVKGIIGVKAMSVIAGVLGDTSKASNYSVRAFSLETGRGIVTPSSRTQSIASSLVTQWQSLATSSDGMHLTLAVRRSLSLFSFRLMWCRSTGMIPGDEFLERPSHCPLLTPASLR